MRIKMPKLSMPKLKLPNISNSKNGLGSLLKNNKNTDSGSILKNAKSKVPDPINKFLPSMDSMKSDKMDVGKIFKQSSFDVEGILSKSTNMSDIANMIPTSFDFGSSFYNGESIPKSVLDQTIDLS